MSRNLDSSQTTDSNISASSTTSPRGLDFFPRVSEAAPVGRYAVIEEDTQSDSTNVVTSGLGALTISALGLAVAGALTLTANAHEANPEAVQEVRGSSNTSPEVAEPAAQKPATDTGPDAATADLNDALEDDALAGALDGRAKDASQTSRTAARAELDQAMSSELAKQRTKQLSASVSKSSEASRERALAARSEQLNSSSSSIGGENQRLKDEAKRKAEAAASSEEGTLQANAQPSASSATSSSAPAAAAGGAQQKAAAGSASAQATAESKATDSSNSLSSAAAREATSTTSSSSAGSAKVMASGTYTVGARYGAVGSWSRYHTGQDLPAPVGTPIYAAADGVVKPSNGGGWAGIHAVIEHDDGGATLYAHLASMSVSPGQQVKAGQQIGTVGMTGRTFGAHLHWEYYPSASTVGNPYTTADPMAWLAARGTTM